MRTRERSNDRQLSARRGLEASVRDFLGAVVAGSIHSKPRKPTAASKKKLVSSSRPKNLDLSKNKKTLSPPLNNKQSRDIHLESFTLLFHGHELLTDAKLELNYGR